MQVAAAATGHGKAERRDLFGHLALFGSDLAVVDEQGEAWSHQAFAEFADRLCACLPAERCLVGVQATNRLRSLAAYVGASRAGHAVLLLKDTEGEDSPLALRFQPDFLYAAEEDRWRPRASRAAAGLHPDLAVLLATSGSTGEPKLVRLSNRNLVSNALSIAEYLEFAPGERAITTLPFHYSYGMSVINSHLTTGGAIILNEASLTEDAFWRRFEATGATSFAGVPHSFDLLERGGFLARTPPASLRYFTQAGGKLPQEAVRRLAEFAEAQGRRFYVMYGQTEAAPRIAYVPPALVRQYPAAIGVPVPGGTISLLDEHGAPIAAPGIEGELVYAGPNVMMGYGLKRADLARGAELAELRTGDLAIRNADGLYTITGRKSRFIKPFGLRIGLDDIEARLRQAGIAAAATGDDKGLQIAAAAPARAEAVAGLILRHHDLPAASVQVIELPEIPRLSSGKADYAGIRGMFAARAAAARLPGQHLPLHVAFARLLGQPDLGREQSFASAGGDSLNYINASLLVEERLNFLPEGWERMPVRELEALPRREADEPAQQAGQSKLYFLDQVRAALMLLGIPFHAALPYIDFPWIVRAGETSAFLTGFADFISTFRMPAFFLLAGFFAMMFVDQRDTMRWWRQRAVQLGVPLVSTILLLNPLMMLASALNDSAGAGVLPGWLSRLGTPGPHWIEHVWFLIFLIAYTLLLALAYRFGRAGAVSRGAAAGGRLILESRANLALAAAAAGAFSMLSVAVLKALGMTFILWNMIYLSEMASLLPVFAMGCLLAARREYIERFATIDALAVALALSGTAILMLVHLREEAAYRALTFFLIPPTGIYWSKILLSVALRWLDTPNRWVRGLVNASMTIYLVHMVIIVFLGVAFALVDLPPVVEFLAITLAAGVLSLGFHRLVSGNWLLMFLFTGIAKGRPGRPSGARSEARALVPPPLPQPRR